MSRGYPVSITTSSLSSAPLRGAYLVHSVAVASDLNQAPNGLCFVENARGDTTPTTAYAVRTLCRTDSFCQLCASRNLQHVSRTAFVASLQRICIHTHEQGPSHPVCGLPCAQRILGICLFGGTGKGSPRRIISWLSSRPSPETSVAPGPV